MLGTLFSLLLLAAAALINRFSKISLHSIFAVFCAVILLAGGVRVGALFVLLAAAVGWSRVRLGRHSPAQVVGGSLLGASAALGLLKVLGAV